jgi:hypothetical protein
LTVNVVLKEELPRAALIVATVWEATGTVVTVKVAEEAPPLTMTLDGTEMAAWSLVSVTPSPEAGAGPFKVSVPVAPPPPSNVVGLTATPVKDGGSTVRVAVSEVEANTAVIVPVESVDTG